MKNNNNNQHLCHHDIILNDYKKIQHSQAAMCKQKIEVFEIWYKKHFMVVDFAQKTISVCPF